MEGLPIQLSTIILNEIEEPLYVVNPEYKIVFANSKSKNELGIQEGNLCYQKIFSRPLPCPFCVIKQKNLAKLHKAKFRRVSRGTTFQQTTFPYKIIHKIIQVDNEFMVLDILQDISEELELEKERYRQEKLIALGTIIQSVAHELINPLTGMGLTLQNLKQRQAELPPPILEKCKLLEQDLRRASDIVADIRLYTQKISYELSPVNIKDIIWQTWNKMHFADEYKLKVEWPDEVTQTIHGNPAKLMQVFQNLFINSVKAYEEKTNHTEPLTITVHAEIISATDPYLKDKKPYLQIQLCDNAGGIAPHLLPHIFEPFFSKRKSNSGSGLGLFIVNRIMKEHRASIEAKNKENGICFSMKFPLQ
ncbi:MAG: sensor histidine kinase [Candidatus Hydrogenedentota bacterium]|nr:MAG: sensor histidine kinase [Candidatus Hydrogenedentota bacterium]